MPQLTSAQIDNLSVETLEDALVIIDRGESRGVYRLIELRKHGMKGIVWRGHDDLGNDVAVKFIPSEEYADISLLDEMTEASRLNTDYFAAIKFFGDARVENVDLGGTFKCVVTEWIDAAPLDDFLHNSAFPPRTS